MVPKETQEWIPGQTSIPAPPDSEQTRMGWFSKSFAGSLLQDSSLHLAEGFTQGLTVLPLTLSSPFIHSPAVSRVMTRIWAINLFYLTMALMIDLIHDKLWGEERETSLKSFTRDACEILLFMLICLPFAINNFIHNMSLVTALREDKLSHLEKYNCPADHQCHKQTLPNVPLLLSEPLSNVGVTAGLALGRILLADYGLLTSGVLQLGMATLYGTSLIQGKLSFCLQKRRQYIKNHVYSVVGYGASMMALSEGVAYLLWLKTGRASPLIDDALFSMIYALYILHSMISHVDFSANRYGFHPFSQVHLYFEASILKNKDALIEWIQGKNEASNFSTEVLQLMQSDPFRVWSTLDFRSLDLFLQNPSAKLYVQLSHATLNKIIAGASVIPDNISIQIGKMIAKWGKYIGLRTEMTDLALALGEIIDRGYLSPAFLDRIKMSIDKAAEAPAVNPVLVPHKNILPRQIDATTGEEIKPPAHTQRPRLFSTSPKSDESKTPSTIIRKEKNPQGPIVIHPDYEGEGRVSLSK